MAINPADTIYSIVRETVEGTINATPAFKGLDYIPGNEFSIDAKTLSSDVLKQNRAMAGLAKTGFSATGSLKTQFRRDTSLDLLLESALSGTFSTNVLKGGNTDSFHTIEKKMFNGATPLYFWYRGMVAKKFGLSVGAGANAEATFDFIGMGRTTGTVAQTGATYTAPTQGPLYTGNDVGTISIAGITGTYMSLDLSVEHNRDAQFALGSTGSIHTGTSGFRTVKLTAKLYRTDLSPETVFLPDTPIAVSFQIGAGTGNAYTVALPAVVGSIPKDEVNSSSALVSVEMTAQYDSTSGTDISITKS